MRTLARWTMGAAGLAALLLVCGCSEGSKDMQIRKLQEDVDRLTGENRDMNARLAAAERNASDSARRAMELQRMLDEARRNMDSGAGASNLPPGWEGNNQVAWIDLPEEILFDSGKASLKGSGKSKVQEIARTIQGTSQFAGREVWVVGFTDNDPIKVTAKEWKDNLDLSCNRAMTVTRELYSLGIDPQRVTAGGQGEYNPRVPNDSKANKAKNRRVQVVVANVPKANFAPQPAGMAEQPR